MDVIMLKEFIDQCSPIDSSCTRESYESDIRQFFDWCNIEPKDVKPINIVSYVSDMRSRKFTSSTVVRKISAIRAYFEFLIYVRVISANPFGAKLKLPRVRREKRPPVTDDEVRAMVMTFDGNTQKGARNLAVFCLMVYNGLRRSEIRRLMIKDIYKENNVIVIKIRGKGDKVRTRPLHRCGFEAISKYLTRTRRQKADGDEPIFRISTQTLYRTIREAAKKAGIKRSVHPHDLRAKFASLSLEAGVPITSVADDLGHASIETTAMYDHSSDLLERSGVWKIEEI